MSNQMVSPHEIDNGEAQSKTRATRSDKGRRRKSNGKTAASALIDVLAALDGLDAENMAKVLSAAAIFNGVANFERRAQ
jgi:hypothetical protein